MEKVLTIGEKLKCIKDTPWAGFNHGIKTDKPETNKNPAFGEICEVSGVFYDPSGEVDDVHYIITLVGYGETLYSARRFERCGETEEKNIGETE
jgi:hypothetical protein